MPNDVGANGQSIVTKDSGGKVITGPDVCKTPVGSSVVPIPYPNISQSTDLAKGSKSVKANGASICLKGSNFSKSSGDQAGKMGGVISGKTGAQADPLTYSFDVKIEGKNVVRNLDSFVSNAKNTAPAPVMQAQVLPSAPFGSDGEQSDQLYSCAWMDCDGKHSEKVDYPNNGCVTRGKYTGRWKAPWEGGAGTKSNEITISHYEAETGKATSLAEAKSLFGTGKYVINNHHLIPIAVMDDCPVLAHNAKLTGFNINDGKYGICLPYFITDIFRHDLQSHKTNHPNYSRKVGSALREIEEDCVAYCQEDDQEQLLSDLKDLCDNLKKAIVSWSPAWLLRNTAVADRKKSFTQAGLPNP